MDSSAERLLLAERLSLGADGAPRRIAVIGLGYVGLPAAVAFARHGEAVVGFDIDAGRIDELERGIDRTGEVEPGLLATTSLSFTANPAELAAANFFIVTVPTPLNDVKHPDLGPLIRASEIVGRALRPGAIVVYESTVYPGVTEEECLPVLERCSGLVAGTDFHIGYSPERINPGDPEHRFENVTKIVSAQCPASLAIIARLYGSVVTAGIHCAPSIRVAEAAKVIENTQRDLNIAFVNELACIFDRIGIDTQDVLAAASTKWNFLPFRPGLVGGHCIGVDPFYLAYRAERAGLHPEVILAGRRVNDGMGVFVARRCIQGLMRQRSLARRVTVLGVSFKENVPDLRNSPVLHLIAELQAHDVDVQIVDPVADAAQIKRLTGIEPTPIAAIPPGQAVILAVMHDAFLAEGWALVKRCLQDGTGAVLDVKACLDRAQVPDGIDLWRL